MSIIRDFRAVLAHLRIGWQFAIVLMLGALLVWAASRAESSGLPWAHGIASDVIRDVGIAFIAVGIAGPISAVFLHAQVEGYHKLVTGAAKSGIVDIFSQRMAGETEAAMLEAIRRERREIRIAGVSLPAFFVPDDRHPLTTAIRKRLEEEPGFRCRVIVCDQDSAYIRERDEIEGLSGHDTNYELLNAHKWIRNLASRFPSRIEARTYTTDSPPVAFVLATSERTFVEQYHSGRPSNHPQGHCIGGHVPLLVLRNDSAFAAYLHAHFEHVWGKKTQPLPGSPAINAPISRPVPIEAEGLPPKDSRELDPSGANPP